MSLRCVAILLTLILCFSHATALRNQILFPILPQPGFPNSTQAGFGCFQNFGVSASQCIGVMDKVYNTMALIQQVRNTRPRPTVLNRCDKKANQELPQGRCAGVRRPLRAAALSEFIPRHPYGTYALATLYTRHR